MQKLHSEINAVLMRWNPIGVLGPALLDEYTKYVPVIAEIRQDREKLGSYLRRLVDELGLEFDAQNQEQVDEIEEVSSKLASL